VVDVKYCYLCGLPNQCRSIVLHVVVAYRKVTGYMPAIPHAPALNATPPLKDYQPMDMTGQRARIPVVTNPPVYSYRLHILTDNAFLKLDFTIELRVISECTCVLCNRFRGV